MTGYFLPGMRGIVAHELYERGESQSKIALILGITQARVSHYLSNKKTRYYSDLSKRFGKSQTELEGFARILAEDASRSQVDGIFTLYSIWKNMLFNGEACTLHQSEFSISKECSVCMDLFRPHSDSFTGRDSREEESAILRDISNSIVALETSSEFPLIMPEVSVNIAVSKNHPKSKRDIAAIPGRISRIHGRAKAFVLPEFGSSNHMSDVLLLFRSKSTKIKAVMNLRYDDTMTEAVASVGLPMANTKIIGNSKENDLNASVPHLAEQVLLRRLANVMVPDSASRTDSPFAVFDEGSEGLEAITYLFGMNATELTQIALKIAHAYSNIIRSQQS
jgi:predicted fused transcriptional regulator/phosphomethylpyrimidine kinase/predicted transcriptional regulator